jgi:hypothetical protein
MPHLHNLLFCFDCNLNNVFVDFEIIMAKNIKDFEVEEDFTKTYFCHLFITYWYIMFPLNPPNFKYNVFENFVCSL